MNDPAATATAAAEIQRRLGYSDVNAKEMIPAPMVVALAEQQRRRSVSNHGSRGGSISHSNHGPNKKNAEKEEKHMLEHATAGGPVYRKLIKPSKSRRGLMRQVSGLGMEDPGFGTRESGPEHPSQIFDDMSVNDLPEDMRDMVSIASDHTAHFDEEGGDEGGLDLATFQASLGDLHRSMSDFSSNELGIPPSASTASSFSSAWHHQKRRSSMGKNSSDQASLASLDLDDVINASKGDRDRFNSSQGNLHNSRSSKVSRGSRNSKGSTKASHATNSSSDNTNHLIRDAALAMQKDGNASHKELIVAALSQSFSEMNCSASELITSTSSRGRGRRRGSNAAAAPSNYEAPEPGSPETRKARLSAKQRAMPSIGTLFPDDSGGGGATVRTKKVRSNSRTKRGGRRPQGLSSSNDSRDNSIAGGGGAGDEKREKLRRQIEGKSKALLDGSNHAASGGAGGAQSGSGGGGTGERVRIAIRTKRRISTNRPSQEGGGGGGGGGTGNSGSNNHGLPPSQQICA